MNLVASLEIALRALASNKMRSGLTMLGIIIGISAVIVLVSVGQGVQVGGGVSVGQGVSVSQGVSVGQGVQVGGGVWVAAGGAVGTGFWTQTQVRASKALPAWS